MDCADYTWMMKVNYLESPVDQFNKTYLYQIIVKRVKDGAVPVQMRSLSVSQDTGTIDPEEPNYFYVMTEPFKPNIWSWKLYKIVKRVQETGAIQREEITTPWRQPLTSTYICIIPPKTLELNTQEYILIGESYLGRASYSFSANSPPSSGSCDVQPKSGVVGSMFHVKCEKFADIHEPLSYTVVGSQGVEEIPWLQYFSFQSESTVESDVHLFSDDSAVLIFDDEGMHTRFPFEVKLSDPSSPPDINQFLSQKLPLMVKQEKEAAVREMAWFTRYFERLNIPFEEVQKMELLEALSIAINFESSPDHLVRGMMTMKSLFTNQLEHTRILTDRVLKYGGEQLHNFAELLWNPTFRASMKYYDQKRMIELITFMAATILQQLDPVIIDNTIREDEHQAHIRRTEQGTQNALQALDYMGEVRRSRQYFQLMPTFNSTHRGVTMLVQVNNASTFNTEFSPDRITGHTMTLPQETVDKYGNIPIFSKMIVSSEKAFWWVPNDSGILSVTAEAIDGDDIDLNGNWTKVLGPFSIYLKLRNFSSIAGSLVGYARLFPECPTSQRLERSLVVYQLKVPLGAGVVFLNFAESSLGLLKVMISVSSRPTYKEVSESDALNRDTLLSNYLNLDKYGVAMFILVYYPLKEKQHPLFMASSTK
uniref:Sperm receptor for egg jelly n=1 Tax=Lygus hesperus TaxID=30085 RepID=A0A0A9XTZ8_LYGHE